MNNYLFLASKGFALLPLILTLALIVAIVSLIYIIFLNKRLLDIKRDSYSNDYNMQSAMNHNFSNEFKTPISNIIEIIEKLKNGFTQNSDSESLIEFEMLLSQSEKLKMLIEGETLVENTIIEKDPDIVVHGNLISFYQYMFENYSELAEFKKIDYLFQSNVKEINIDYKPDSLKIIINNLVGKALKICSEGDSVRVKIIINNNIKYYILDIAYSLNNNIDPIHFERYLELLTTKQIVSKLNGSIDYNYTAGVETLFSIKLPISNHFDNLPSGCLTIHKPVKSGITIEKINNPDSNNGSNLDIDPEFLTRVTTLIYREITNTDNIIDIISSELCLSSSQLNRRIKLLTGMTTSNFILKTRLNRAKKRLVNTQKQIGEVALECGFNDFAYFSRSFKKEFGMTPTTFQRLPHSAN